MQQTREASKKHFSRDTFCKNIMEDYFDGYLSFHPLFASRIGYREYDGNLVNYYSKDHVNAKQYFYQELLFHPIKSSLYSFTPSCDERRAPSSRAASRA